MGDETKLALQELRVSQLEVKGSLADLRLSMPDRFSEVNVRLADVDRKLDLIIDTLAEFRTEYNEHTHGSE